MPHSTNVPLCSQANNHIHTVRYSGCISLQDKTILDVVHNQSNHRPLIVAIESRLPCSVPPLVSSGARFGCSGILSISAFASSQASRFCTIAVSKCRTQCPSKPTDLLAPVPMAPRHADRHLAQVSDLLSLEPVQVRLDRRA